MKEKLYKFITLTLGIIFLLVPNNYIYANEQQIFQNNNTNLADSENQIENKNNNEVQKYVIIGDSKVTLDDNVLQDPQYYQYFDEEGNCVQNYNHNQGIDEDYSKQNNLIDEQVDDGLARASGEILGCDVSRWQGDIDWNQAKRAGIQYAFIRVGYRGRTSGTIELDPYYKQNIQNALAAGIKVGVYFYSEAITEQEAVEEAEILISNIYMYNITMPLVIDYEGFNENERIGQAKLSKTQYTDIVNKFCEKVKQAGYTPMVYASSSYFTKYLEGEYLSNAYRIWSAAYSNRPEHYNSIKYDFWQFTSTANGKAYGMQSADLDLDYWYNNREIFGNDYSAVFDAEYYYNKYPDLQQKIGYNPSELLYHYINFGMSEGRNGNASFDVVSYRARYTDLQKAFGSDLKRYVYHYMSFGKKEGRNGSKDDSFYTVQFVQNGKIVNSQQVEFGHAAYTPNNLFCMNGASLTFDKKYDIVTSDLVVNVDTRYLYNGVDYTDVFNADYYINKYPDIKNTYGTNGQMALSHFVSFGMNEGRLGNDAFNVISYRNRYSDLRRVFGNDLKSYYIHYIGFGKKENRETKGYESHMVDIITEYNGIDYSNVYDYNYYISHNLDVLKAYGDDDSKALAHFVCFGMNEGRIAKSTFNVISYKNRYPDLRKAYGNNLKNYYMHYIGFGSKENREATGYENKVVDAVTEYNGVDYSDVYDFNYYILHNPDIYKVYGYDENKVLSHFITFGMNEGRIAKNTFNVKTYKSRYADLRKVYGNNNKMYYMHYIGFGKKEGRRAS